MVDGLPVLGESAGAVGHQPLALGAPDLGAEIGLGALAEDAIVLLALGGVAWDYNVARLDRSHSISDGLDNCRGLMPEHAREQPFWVMAVQGVDVGVAERVGDHLHADLTRGGGRDLHGK